MGLGIAIGGAMGALTIFVVILTYPMVSENLVETTNARSEILDKQNMLRKTSIDIPILFATSGNSIINFTLSNTGMEKIWDYDNFNVIVNYDADIGGTSTPTIEEITFEANSSFLGSVLEYDPVTTQFARPISDEVTGTWTSTPLYEKIDEVIRDDGDFVSSFPLTPIGATDTFEVLLSSVNEPSSLDGHIVRVVHGISGGAIDIDITVRLLDGSTQIASWTNSTIPTLFTQSRYTLTSTEANSINNYSDLRIEITAERTGGIQPRNAEISWVEFEVPNNQIIEINCNSTSGFDSGEWILSNISQDELEPRIINQNEVAHVCIQLSNPVFANGDVSLNIASDVGRVASQSTTGI